MDKENLGRIRRAVLLDLDDFTPKPSPYLPIHFPGYINPADWDVAKHIKLRQIANPQLVSIRQYDALSLFECIIALAEAEEDGLNYNGTDLKEKEFHENYINDRWNYLEKALKIYVGHLTLDEKKVLLKDCDELLSTEPIDITKKTSEVDSKEDELQDVKEEPKPEEPPGKAPRNAVNKLAVKAAWKFECLYNKKASARDVMSIMQDWADNNKYPETLSVSNKPKKSVTWITVKMNSKEYSLEACGKTLAVWHKSRH